MIDSFKEFLDKDQQARPKSLVAWYAEGDERAAALAQGLIEEGHTYSFKKGYHARFDRAVAPNQQDHLHVMLRNNDVCVINKDGTASHKSDLSRLPGHVKDSIRRLGVVMIKESGQLVEQAAVVLRFTVPRSVMTQFKIKFLATTVKRSASSV
ncbi:hypothetical protein [Aminobacter carboxidus]|uniref:Uncharacterized protein n=1 Tax=Aminobacter carboxidus TaxID=376165 RepID=A0ABR9GWR0_9HYPH|nr:hypothetical protein [Aminobacter carboxidus]MBE1208122.1 hypothetical protein [Aminobacter carboxidus]